MKEETDLAQIGVDPITVEGLADERARAIVNYLAVLMALSQEMHWSHRELVDWVQNHYADRGHYDEWLAKYGWGNAAAFLADFLLGRRLVYQRSTVRSLPDGGYEVVTPIWYRDSPPEAFFFFDIDPDEFADYVRTLTYAKAARIGIEVHVENQGGCERAVIRSALAGMRPSS